LNKIGFEKEPTKTREYFARKNDSKNKKQVFKEY